MAEKQWRFVLNTLSETKILDLYPNGDEEYPRPLHMGVPRWDLVMT